MRTTFFPPPARVVSHRGAISLCSALLVLAAASSAFAQTAASHVSAVGTWKADLQESKFASGEAPTSLMLTITEDTPQLLSWRVDEVDAKGTATSYSWSGPQDGTLQPLKGADGKDVGKESFKNENGVTIRHAEGGGDEGSMDSHVTMSADGNTMTDVITAKTKDGKPMNQTVVWRREPAAKDSPKK